VSDVIEVNISDLQPHPQNARTHDIPKIMRSLERFGLVKFPIVQRSSGRIIAGHGTVEAAKKLGWTRVKIQLIDVDDDTALGYLIADNSASDKSGYDKGKLVDLLGSALSLEGLGFDEDDIEALREEVSGKKESKRKAPAADIDIESKEAESSDDGSSGSASEPMREIPLRMTSSELKTFSDQIRDLQRLWGSRTLVEVVSRAVLETHQRYQAQEVGARGSAAAAPDLIGTEF
jgi:ParB-like chromosome segregation protein Spo0J